MKMKLVRKIVSMGMLLLMLLSLSACQKEEGETKKKTSETNVAAVTETPSTTEETDTSAIPKPPEGTFDFEYLSQNIIIDGKKVSLPFTLDDLGEEYTFNEIGISEGIIEHRCGVQVIFPDGKYIQTFVKEDKKADVTRKSEIMSITVYSSNENNISIDGIKDNSNISDIKKKFGEPTKIDYGNSINHWYYESENGRLHFSIENEKIQGMTIYMY